MTKTITVYKVVALRPSSSNLGGYDMRSFCGEFGGNAVAIEYKIGCKAQPLLPNSALYAFKNLRIARDFATWQVSLCHFRYGYAILKCTAAASDDEPLISKYVATDKIKRFWSNNWVKMCTVSSAPVGTVMCKWVKPTQVVESKLVVRSR